MNQNNKLFQDSGIEEYKLEKGLTRNEEYRELMAELELPGEGVEQTLIRARKRKKKRDRIRRPLIGMAACFALFVLLVNFSMPVAYACSQIPILKDLAEAVTFSRSLTDAVENDYVQPINLVGRDGDVSAKVEYLIVDQKQVNVFYRLYSDVYTQMNAEPRIMLPDGSSPGSCSYGVNDWDVPNGELQSITIDFFENDVPGELLLKMNIRDMGAESEAPKPYSEDDAFLSDYERHEAEYVASFEFLLAFDPEYTEQGKIYELNKTVIMEGQKITIKDVAVYPTHLRVNITDDHPENSAWLQRLYFSIQMNNSVTFDSLTNGIIATGDGQGNTSFRADSPFFYEADKLEIVITGAEWLNKDMETTYINLETGETGKLPDGVTFHSAEEKSQGWILRLRAVERKEAYMHQLLSNNYYDADGNEYYFYSWGTYSDYEFGDEANTQDVSHFNVEYFLTDYHEKEVWVSPYYSHIWTAEEPVVVNVK